MFEGNVVYRAALRALDMKALGCVHGDKKEANPDITVKLSCHAKADLGPYLEAKLTVAAPLSMHRPNNKYSSFSKIYSESILQYSIEKINTEEKLQEVPQAIRDTHRFNETAQGIDNGRPGVVKLTLAYDPDDSTHEGLYNTLQFKNYVDPETDEDLGDKPHIQHAIDSIRNIFAQPGEIVFYLRNEETDFELEFVALIKEMRSTIKKDGTPRVPFLQIGVQVPITDRPPISTLKTFIHRDFTDFATRKGYAAIQSMEYEHQEVQKFNDTPASVKFLTIPGGGNQKYLAVLYIDPDVEKRMQVGDTVWISFSTRPRDISSSAEWKTQIVDPLPWLKSGETAGIVTRPREPHLEMATEEQRKIARDFVKGRLPAGDGCVPTDERLTGELDKQRYIQVRLRLESSDQTQGRQVNTLHILQRAQRLNPDPLPGTRAEWVDRPILKNWQDRLCNKSQIPTSYTDILGGAEEYLKHLEAADHLEVIEYLRQVPTLNNIALGIIQGRAGVGKTFVIASVITALLRKNPKKKILVLTPSNEPCDVAARKIGQEMQKHDETKDLVVMRAHNVAAEKNYVIAHAKLEALKRKMESDKLKPKEELDVEKARQIKINQKRARDFEAEALIRKKALAEMQKNMPSKTAPEEAEDIITPDLMDEDDQGASDKEVDPDIVLDNVLQPLIHEFNDEVVVSEGCFRADGSIDIERLERDNTLGKAHAGLRLSRYLSSFMSAGDRLIKDPRFQEVKQSLAWTILVVVGGIVPHRNKYTDEEKWAAFRVLFRKYMEEGEMMDADERTALDQTMKELREYCVSISSVLLSTENNIASGLYASNFDVDLLIIDEANRSLITDTVISIAHMEPNQIILVGDTKQLKPVVVGPTPLTGFLRELEVSTMAYFLDVGWPAASIYIQRRSRAGIMDIPTHRYYHGNVHNGPDADNDEVFFHTRKAIKVVNRKFKDVKVQNFPSMFFEIPGSEAFVDPVTKSRYNLGIASVVMNMVDLFVLNSIHPRDQGIVTPYMAQVLVYKYAAHQLHLQFPNHGYDQLLIGTADSMEGEERPVMHVDTVVTHEIGFVDDAGRMLVMMTRAKHANLTYGNSSSLYQKTRRESELIWLFDVAKSDTRKICREIPETSVYRHHAYVQNRTIQGDPGQPISQEDLPANSTNSSIVTAPTSIAAAGVSDTNQWSSAAAAVPTNNQWSGVAAAVPTNNQWGSTFAVPDTDNQWGSDAALNTSDGTDDFMTGIESQGNAGPATEHQPTPKRPSIHSKPAKDNKKQKTSGTGKQS